MRKIRSALFGLVALSTPLLAANVASAWEITGLTVTPHCYSQPAASYIVTSSAKNGTITATDSTVPASTPQTLTGPTGLFDVPAGTQTITVSVTETWVTGEHSHTQATVSVADCVPVTTTTTVAPTTTTLPATTTTLPAPTTTVAPPSTTVPPTVTVPAPITTVPVSVPVPPKPTPAVVSPASVPSVALPTASLADTGAGSDLWVVAVVGVFAIIGGSTILIFQRKRKGGK